MEIQIHEMKDRLARCVKPAQAEAAYLRRIRALPWVRPGSAGKVKGAARLIRLPRSSTSGAEVVLEDRR